MFGLFKSKKKVMQATQEHFGEVRRNYLWEVAMQIESARALKESRPPGGTEFSPQHLSDLLYITRKTLHSTPFTDAENIASDLTRGIIIGDNEMLSVSTNKLSQLLMPYGWETFIISEATELWNQLLMREGWANARFVWPGKGEQVQIITAK